MEFLHHSEEAMSKSCLVCGGSDEQRVLIEAHESMLPVGNTRVRAISEQPEWLCLFCFDWAFLFEARTRLGLRNTGPFAPKPVMAPRRSSNPLYQGYVPEWAESLE